nr:uncharacterized protein LOC113399032 isoform X2 [Vanessa tameamea]
MYVFVLHCIKMHRNELTVTRLGAPNEKVIERLLRSSAGSFAASPEALHRRCAAPRASPVPLHAPAPRRYDAAFFSTRRLPPVDCQPRRRAVALHTPQKSGAPTVNTTHFLRTASVREITSIQRSCQCRVVPNQWIKTTNLAFVLSETSGLH